MVDTANIIPSCVICGSPELEYYPVLWQELINEWNLSDAEANYVNLQQGLCCVKCKANLRSMALARAFMRTKNYDGLFCNFVKLWRMQNVRVLEINKAGQLTPFLRRMRYHKLVCYPEIDMMNMSYQDNTIDLILHSDTLEHVSNPVKALSECCRVLKKGGFCIFTIPIVVDRLTRTREGLSPSFHGRENQKMNDLLVYTEYGADFWKQVIMAGFSECHIYSLAYPFAQAVMGVK